VSISGCPTICYKMLTGFTGLRAQVVVPESKDTPMVWLRSFFEKVFLVLSRHDDL
jgi:hypothetical protein